MKNIKILKIQKKNFLVHYIYNLYIILIILICVYFKMIRNHINFVELIPKK